MYRRSAIVGIGQSEFTRKSEYSAWDLCLQAVLRRSRDAGLDAKEIDGLDPLRRAQRAGQSGPARSRAGHSRGALVVATRRTAARRPAPVISHAAAAIAARQASVVVVYRSLSQSTSGRMGRADSRYGSERGGVRQRRPHARRRIQRALRAAVTRPGVCAVGQSLQVRKRDLRRRLGARAGHVRHSATRVRAHQSSGNHERSAAHAGTTTTTRA